MGVHDLAHYGPKVELQTCNLSLENLSQHGLSQNGARNCSQTAFCDKRTTHHVAADGVREPSTPRPRESTQILARGTCGQRRARIPAHELKMQEAGGDVWIRG